MYNVNFSINIYNPPTPASEGPNHNYISTFGVSFHSTINEYKVFQFFFKEERPYECMVYSSTTGSWKSIANVAHGPNSSNEHVCINGIVYWLCQSRLGERLVGYILAIVWEEIFSIIRILEEETMKPFLVNLEGCFCMVVVAKVNGNF